VRCQPVVSFVVLSLIACLGCSSRDEPVARPQVPTGAIAGDYAAGPCVHLANDVEYEAECGTVIVPENRNDPGSRLIALPVIRILSVSNNPAEPIFFLAGGPGSSNMRYSRIEWFLDNHDIVLVGYRGIDGSVFLGCPELDVVMRESRSLMSPSSMTAQGVAVAECADRLTREGIDLAGYTVLEVVDDIEDGRRALGYDRINLESASYGTRLAQIYSWRYPERLHRNAMVAVNPPGRFEWDGAILEDQIRRYARLCAGDEYCSSRTDDLVESIRTALEEMPERWLVFPVDRDAVLFATFMGLYSVESAASTFDVWLSAADGDYSGMALITAAMGQMLPRDYAWGDGASKALSADYDFDPSANYSAEVTPGPYLLGSPASTLGWAAAGSWPANKIPDEYRLVRPSSVETLMLSGTLDVSTPARNATDQLLPMLENGEQIVLSEFAHTSDLYYLQEDATRRLLRTFFETGEVDRSAFVPHRVNFEPGWGFPLIAKLLVGGAALLLILVLATAAFVVRRIRRR